MPITLTATVEKRTGHKVPVVTTPLVASRTSRVNKKPEPNGHISYSVTVTRLPLKLKTILVGIRLGAGPRFITILAQMAYGVTVRRKVFHSTKAITPLTASVVRQTNHRLSVSSSIAGFILKQTRKPRLATLPLTAEQTHNTFRSDKTIAAVMSLVAAAGHSKPKVIVVGSYQTLLPPLFKGLGLVASASMRRGRVAMGTITHVVPAPRKQVRVVRLAGTPLVATASPIKTFIRSLSVTFPWTATVIRRVARTRSAQVPLGAAVVRTTQKTTLAQLPLAVESVSKRKTHRVVTTPLVLTAALSTRALKSVTTIATSLTLSVVSVRRFVTRSLPVAQVQLDATVTRRTAKTARATIHHVVRIIGGKYRTIHVLTGLVATIHAVGVVTLEKVDTWRTGRHGDKGRRRHGGGPSGRTRRDSGGDGSTDADR